MICHSLLGNRATRIPCVVGANSASTTEKKFKNATNQQSYKPFWNEIKLDFAGNWYYIRFIKVTNWFAYNPSWFIKHGGVDFEFVFWAIENSRIYCGRCK